MGLMITDNILIILIININIHRKIVTLAVIVTVMMIIKVPGRVGWGRGKEIAPVWNVRTA